MLTIAQKMLKEVGVIVGIATHLAGGEERFSFEHI